jgi:hypothetical protein
VDSDEESEQDGRISDSAGVAHGASRVASRGANRMVRGRRRGARTGWCASVCAGRCQPSWTVARRASRAAASARSVGFAHGASRFCIDSGCRLVLTVEGAVRVRMPLHGVPLRLCVCRASSAIVDSDEESEQDGALVSVRGRSIWGHADIVQTSMTHPDGQPRAGFGDVL